MNTASIGIIGGSGLYHLQELSGVSQHQVSTPYGSPSSTITIGALAGTSVAFLPRHGEGHRLPPSDIPFRANLYALKMLGVERIISISAVGSLQEHIHPLDLVVPDQLIDRTKHRPSTFFEEGIVAHVGFADPFCYEVSSYLTSAARQTPGNVHPSGTYVAIEGPSFSTRAESSLYRSWGASIIGMTALPEAKLAREAEICYAALACVTDYDVWHETEESVSVEQVIQNLGMNITRARCILETIIPQLVGERSCACKTALANAIVTQVDMITPEIRHKLAPIIGSYVK